MRTKDEIKTEVRGYMVEAHGPAFMEVVTDDSRIFGLDGAADSLDRADLAMFVETEFKITMDDHTIRQLTSINSLVDAIDVAQRAESADGR